MAARTTGINVPGSWGWPQNLPKASTPDDTSTSRPTPTQQPNQSSDSSTSPPQPDPEQPSAQMPEDQQKHYKPRTCRICLETVLPTFHPPSQNLPGMFQGRGNVTYDSEDGRLIRPCKCKGSSRYVHESCLQEWRHADPGYGKRNYWQCPTCGFKYRLERMNWGRWISSKGAQVGLTALIFVTTIFLLGFVADPIINMYVDPVSTITSIPQTPSTSDRHSRWRPPPEEDEVGWAEHFLKGIASLGVIGFLKMFFSMSPLYWFNRNSWGFGFGGGGVARGGQTGRDRAANLSWVVVVVGVVTFLFTVWKGVRAWSRRVLEKASERVMDVPLDGDDDEDA